MFKCDGHVRKATVEDIQIGTVLRWVNREEGEQAVSSYSDCTVIEVRKGESVKGFPDITWVEVVRPYLYANSIGVCPNFLMGVERFKVELNRIVDNYHVVLMSTGKVAQMNNRG